MRKQLLCLLLVISSGMSAARAEDSAYESIRQCIAETHPELLPAWDAPYSPEEEFVRISITNWASIEQTLTNAVSAIRDVENRTWRMNEPIARQIDRMLQWAVMQAVDDTLEWVASTNGAAWLAETNQYARWAVELRPKHDIIGKVVADKRSAVTSINWPVVFTNCPSVEDGR